jgi:integrase
MAERGKRQAVGLRPRLSVRQGRLRTSRIRGFDKEPISERPTASVDQVCRLAALMPRRFRTMVICAAFTGLRWGELVALRARDVDLDTGVVHVVRKFAELQSGERVPGRPKSDAGLRTVA